MIEQVKEIIEKDINPQLAMHAGGCELIDVDDGIVTLNERLTFLKRSI